MIECEEYSSKYELVWNEFVQTSRIDSFLFKRNFMEYHSYKFSDSSFLFFKNSKLICLLPGNINEDIFYSHQGLTYGGLLLSEKASLIDVLEIFKILLEKLRKKYIRRAIFKLTPYIYHLAPNEEEKYALFINNAELIGSQISSTIFLNSKLSFSESRKSGIRKANRFDVKNKEIICLIDFWQLLNSSLNEKYGRSPVHSAEELNYLKLEFPENIKIFGSYFNERLIGGVVLFIMQKVVHVQYITSNDLGKEMGALDKLFDFLINDLYRNYVFFDFGHSTEGMGISLNQNLLFQKEGFGARGIVYETYQIEL